MVRGGRSKQNTPKSMVFREEEGNASAQEMDGGPFPVLGEGEH
jgi:hypothetical protein